MVFERTYLFLPDMLVGEDALGAEDLLVAELAELPPVVAGRGEENVLPVVGHDAAGHELGPGREYGVVGLEHLAGDLLGSDHHNGDLTHAEAHQRAVHVGQVAQRPVRQLVHQPVRAPDHREVPRPRRKPARRRRLQQAEEGDGQERQDRSRA